MHHIFFISSLVDGHDLAIINSAAVNIGVRVSFFFFFYPEWDSNACLFELWFSQDLCPVMGLLCHMVALALVFQ